MFSSSFLGVAASLLGTQGVIAGAFGSHYLRERLDANQTRAWTIAVQYQLIHATAVFAVAVATKSNRTMPGADALRRGASLWVIGTVLFSGSLYMLALGKRGIWGPMTPVGGLVMILGWVSTTFGFLE